MFAASSFQFVKSVGKNTLHPVPSIDEADNVKPFQLVIKSVKRRFIFFEKAVYKPTEFQITDIMDDTDAFKTKPATINLMSDYNRVTKLSLKGQFGGDIYAELEASDTIELDIKFGKVSKLEVKEPELLEEISRRCINLDHPYIQQIRKNPKKTLCLITGVIYLPDGGTIHRNTELDTCEAIKATILKGVNESASSQYIKDRNFALCPNTPVAYSLHELNVDQNTGAIQLVLAKDSHGGFKPCIGYDEPDAMSVNSRSPSAGYEHKKQLELDLQKPKAVFKPLFDLSEPERSKVNSWLLQVLSVPKDTDLFSNLLDESEEGRQLKMKVEDVRTKFVSTSDACLELLKFVGFQIADGFLDHSTKKTARMHAVAEFFDAASVLDDETCAQLCQCPKNLSEPLLKVLHDGIEGKTITDSNILQALKGSSVCQKILLDQEFHIRDNEIEAPAELPYTIDEVYWVVYALYGP